MVDFTTPILVGDVLADHRRADRVNLTNRASLVNQMLVLPRSNHQFQDLMGALGVLSHVADEDVEFFNKADRRMLVENYGLPILK